jgi:Kef-type K+ transport system membrane component KefB
MTDYQILRDLGLVLIGAALLLFAARPLRVPPILTYMLAGLALGPLAGLLTVSGSLDLFAELGVALLLFVVGLELSLDRIRAVGRTAVVAGSVQVAVIVALGAALARALGVDGAGALLAGLVAAFSSTVVVVKLLDRLGELGRLHGRLAIGILLVQDVLVAVVLTLLGGLGAPGAAGGSPWPALALALLGITGLALAGAAAARWVLPGFVRWMSAAPEGLFVVALTWVFGFILTAEALQLSIELGAFLAGVVLAQLPYNDELRRRTHPLVDFFLAVFFVSLGARMDPAAMAATWPAALAISAFVLVAKPVVIAVLLALMGQPRRASALAGLTLGQVSEFGFILTGLAVGAGLVGPDFLGLVSLVGLLTIGVSAVLVPGAGAFVDRLERRGLLDLLPGAGGEDETIAAPLARHVVVVGMNTLGRMLVRRFGDRGEDVLAVDTDASKLEGVGTRTLVGDVTIGAVIEAAGIPRAKLVVSTLQIEDVNSLLAYRCARLAVPVSIHAFDPTLVDELLEIGADHLMVSKHDGIRMVEAALRRLGVLG